MFLRKKWPGDNRHFSPRPQGRSRDLAVQDAT
jgi:hypothetical protein